MCSGAGPVAPQPQPQVLQSKPSFVAHPPVHVSVPALDSAQLLNSGFDPLAQFMNPHPTEPSAEPGPAVTGAPVVSGLLNANAPGSQMPPETHPFLNQHPILPSPGMCCESLCHGHFGHFHPPSETVGEANVFCYSVFIMWPDRGAN